MTVDIKPSLPPAQDSSTNDDSTGTSPPSTLVPDDYQIDPDNYWVFGYGSLIYKPPPHTERRVPGYITGYVRRFWQSSNDHRGTPQAPGRVVTLIEHAFWRDLTAPGKRAPLDPHQAPRNGKTWGVAYKISPQHAQRVKEYLDFREKNGYTEHRVPFTTDPTYHAAAQTESATDNGEGPAVPAVLMCHVYIGTPDNEAFVGPQHPEALARHIVRSRGPSGENREYLYNLHRSLRALHTLDPAEAEQQAAATNGAPEYEWPEDEHISDLVRLARQYEKEV